MSKIALVVLDTLRKDAFDHHFDWLPGIRFENAVSTSHWTVPSHAGLFTGRYGSEVGVHAKSQHLDYTEPVLAELLSENGYTTRAFSANPKISRHFDFNRGFGQFKASWRVKPFNQNVYDWSLDEDESRVKQILEGIGASVFGDWKVYESLKYGMQLKLRKSGVWRTADDGAKAAFEMVQNSAFGEDEFLFMNLMEAHPPWNPPGEYNTLGGSYTPGIGILRTVSDEPENDGELLKQAYEDSVRYLSDIYSDIFEELTKSFDYIFTVADHGTMFGENGVWEHDYGLYPELTHVPLSVYDGSGESSDRDELVSLIDIHATILELSSIKNQSRGQHLLEDREDRQYLSEFHGLTEFKINRLREAGYDEATISTYDRPMHAISIPPTYYGYETKDGFSETGSNSKAVEPRERLDELVENLDVRSVDDDVSTLSSAARAQLKDLGYI